MREQTLVILKPDAIMMSVEDMIMQRYQDAGLKILEEDYRQQLSQETVIKLYSVHEGQCYFAGLVLAMVSGPCMILILEGEDAIKKVRAMHGATDPKKAERGTIRFDFMSAGGPFNTVHASDSPEAFERERSIFFPTK